MTETAFRWIASERDLAQAARELDDQPRIAFDTEFMRVSTLLPKLALLQIHCTQGALLIDPLALDDLAPLEQTFADPRPKVAHSVSEDLIALSTRLPQPLGQLFDTQIAAAFVGFGYGIGYQSLVRDALGVELPKDQTRSDWTRRPLGAQQLAYAAADVEHLAPLHDLLGERLLASGRLTWCEEECRRMLSGSTLRSPVGADAHWRLPSAWRHDSAAQVRMRRLLIWREDTALRLDKPRPWIIDDPTIVALATASSWDTDSIGSAVRGLRACPRSEYAALAELLVATATQGETASLRLAPAPPDRATEKRTNALRDAVAKRALELDLPAPLVASRRLLDAAIAGHPLDELRGWRAQVLGDLITANTDVVIPNPDSLSPLVAPAQDGP
ncbi:MAG: ribonuclease D [Lysobacterales bacterium]